MKMYKKPCSINLDGERAFAPAIAASTAAISSLSVTGAALIGAAAGLALKGDRDYKGHRQGLPKCVKDE